MGMDETVATAYRDWLRGSESVLCKEMIHEMGLSVRARRACARLGITQARELTSFTRSDIAECKNTGDVTVAEIERAMTLRGLAFKPEPTNTGKTA